ncbi:MAG: hypothetical protein ACREUV_07515, partial [Burkholderiales bacterium]
MSTHTSMPDAAQLTKAYSDMAQQSQQMVADFLQRHASTGAIGMGDELGVGKAFLDLTAKMMADPFKLAEMQWNMWQDYMTLWQGSVMKMMGQDAAPVAEPAPSDRRFKDEAWQQNFLFDYIKQSYLIAARHLHGAVASVEGLDDQTTKKADFFTRQFIDALSPTNFVMTNPEVLRETVESGGQNLVKGLKNLLEDLERGDNKQLRIRMTDLDAFKLGKNVATTQGKVVFQNELMQLIQYQPATDKVYQRPLLI